MKINALLCCSFFPCALFSSWVNRFENFFPHSAPPASVEVIDTRNDSAARGVYFPTVPIDERNRPHGPVFNELWRLLPEPLLGDDHDRLWDLYWFAWDRALTHVKIPPVDSPLPKPYADAAFSNHLFQWDTIFILGYMKYGDSAFPAIQSFDNFYSRQHDTGYIDREIDSATGEDVYFENAASTVNPPLFAWAEVDYAQLTGDTSRFPRIYLALKKYAEWLENGRKAFHSVHQLYWNTSLGAGMDNSPRKGSGWVDMSSQMVIMYQSLAQIAATLKNDAEANQFRLQAQSIAAGINQYMWDEEDGIYYDVDDNGKRSRHKTIAGFWPMFAGISTPKQVERMVATLRNPNLFWRKNVFPSLAADQQEYYEGGDYWVGSVWAPTNVMIIKGLERYEMEVPAAGELLSESLNRYLAGMSAVFRDTHTIWENYAPDFLERGSFSKPDFLGWSGAGPVQLLIEDDLGIRANALTESVTWDVRRTDGHGIANFRFGPVVTRLYAEPRTTVSDPTFFSVDSNRPYTLFVRLNGMERSVAIEAGQQRIFCAPIGRCIATRGQMADSGSVSYSSRSLRSQAAAGEGNP